MNGASFKYLENYNICIKSKYNHCFYILLMIK